MHEMNFPPAPADLARQARLHQWWNSLAKTRDRSIARHPYYYREMANFFKGVVLEGQSALEAGCGTGFLLRQLPGAKRKGVDFAEAMIEEARAHADPIEFEAVNIEQQPVVGVYDHIILCDVINELTDVWRALRHLRTSCHPETRLTLTRFNPWWQPVFKMAAFLRLRTPHREQNWFTPEDVRQLLEISNFEVVREGSRILLPIYLPIFSTLLNRYVSHLPLFRALCCVQFTIARPKPDAEATPRRPLLSCSVIVPCLNEKGHLASLVQRTPAMGAWTELVFVDGGSTDGTWELLEDIQRTYPGPLKIRRLRQKGRKGKGQGVQEGFAAATGDVLMILDADLTVQPEDLPKFFLAIQEGHADYINGSRLVYPLKDKSMRFLNHMANRLFGKLLSGIVNHRLMDTLCGTKALRRESYQLIRQNKAFFGDFDPFGDFELIFGAAHLNLRIVEIPVRYQARVYGETKIRRFYHGWLLVRMMLFALKRFR